MFLPQTKQNKKAQEMFGDDEYVYNLIMVKASWVCAYVQIHAHWTGYFSKFKVTVIFPNIVKFPISSSFI